jgi:hypothetical protein
MYRKHGGNSSTPLRDVSSRKISSYKSKEPTPSVNLDDINPFTDRSQSKTSSVNLDGMEPGTPPFNTGINPFTDGSQSKTQVFNPYDMPPVIDVNNPFIDVGSQSKTQVFNPYDMSSENEVKEVKEDMILGNEFEKVSNDLEEVTDNVGLPNRFEGYGDDTVVYVEPENEVKEVKEDMILGSEFEKVPNDVEEVTDNVGLPNRFEGYGDDTVVYVEPENSETKRISSTKLLSSNTLNHQDNTIRETMAGNPNADIMQLINDTIFIPMKLNFRLVNDYDERCIIYIKILKEFIENFKCLKDIYDNTDRTTSMIDINNLLTDDKYLECKKILNKYQIDKPKITYLTDNSDINKTNIGSVYTILYKLFEKSYDPVKEQQKRKGTYNSKKDEFNQVKCFLDGCDIAHDVSSKSVYFNTLIAKNNKIDTISTSSTGINQERIRELRNKEIIELKTRIRDISIKDENITIKTLSAYDGLVEFFKEMGDIWDSKGRPPIKDLGRFAYRESGRELSLEKVLKYKNNTDFVDSCKSNNKLKDFFVELQKIDDETQSIEIEKNALSTFDACKQKIDFTNPDNRKKHAIFENVYGCYDYHVFSIVESDNEFYHFVYVMDSLPTLLNRGILAIFLIRGDVSINFLILSNNTINNNHKIDTKRLGTAKNTSFIQNSKDIINSLKNNFLQLNPLSIKGSDVEFMNALEISLTNPLQHPWAKKGYYFKTGLTPGEQQLLLLGNKTIGDLIFTKYLNKEGDNEIYSLSTTDSLVWGSVVYNYLCGNSKFLQSVWQTAPGSGSGYWSHRKGIFSTSIESNIKFTIVQIASIFSFVKYYPIIFNGPDPILGPIQPVKPILSKILSKVFKIKNIYVLDVINNVILQMIQFNRVYHALYYIKLLYTTVWAYTDNIYSNFFYELFRCELNYKINFSIRKYVSDIYSLAEANVNDLSDIKDRLFNIPKLCNMLYVNTMVDYLTNKVNTFPSVTNVPGDSPISQFFNIDPNITNVLKKEPVVGVIGEKTALFIGMYIMNNYRNDVARLIIGIHILPINKYISSSTSHIDGYKFYDGDEIKTVLFKEKNGPYDKFFQKNISAAVQFYRDYSINLTPDMLNSDGTYFKLIYNTLNTSTIEILMVIKSRSTVTKNDSNIKISNILTFGKTDDPWDTGHKLQLLEIPNTIGNLFHLLMNYRSISTDTTAVRMIITKIMSYFNKNLLMYKDKDSDYDHLTHMYQFIRGLGLQNAHFRNMMITTMINTLTYDEYLLHKHEIQSTPMREHQFNELLQHDPTSDEILKFMFYIYIKNTKSVEVNDGDEEVIEDDNYEEKKPDDATEMKEVEDEEIEVAPTKTSAKKTSNNRTKKNNKRPKQTEEEKPEAKIKKNKEEKQEAKIKKNKEEKRDQTRETMQVARSKKP